jgi:hypothetical protein
MQYIFHVPHHRFVCLRVRVLLQFYSQLILHSFLGAHQDRLLFPLSIFFLLMRLLVLLQEIGRAIYMHCTHARTYSETQKRKDTRNGVDGGMSANCESSSHFCLISVGPAIHTPQNWGCVFFTEQDNRIFLFVYIYAIVCAMHVYRPPDFLQHACITILYTYVLQIKVQKKKS